MKTFYDLTDEEKMNLTEDQIIYYAKLECAQRGIIVPLKPVNELKEFKTPSKKFYQVGYESFVFETEEDAQKYVDIITKALTVKRLGNDYNSKDQYVTTINTTTEIKPITLYTEEEAKNVKSDVLYNESLTNQITTFEKANMEFNLIVKELKDCVEEFLYYSGRVDYYGKVFEEYLTLAEGNHEMAQTFFNKAYSSARLSEVDAEIVAKMIKK
jgi:SepF-like predicted cell division protein (DUF552 family)